MEPFPSLSDILIAIVFGVLLPFSSGLRSKSIFQSGAIKFNSDTRIRFYLSNSAVLFLSAALVLLNWAFHRRDYSILGLQGCQPGDTASTALLTVLFLALYLTDLWTTFGDKKQRTSQLLDIEKRTPFLPKGKKEIPAYLILCMSAAIFEELIYRGYLIAFFSAIFSGVPGASAWSLLVPSFVFSIAHYYQGAKAVFKIMVLSTLFGIIFQKSGALWVVASLHFLVDCCSGLVAAYLFHQESKRSAR